MSNDIEQDALVRITIHEAVCAERYENISTRIKKLEAVQWAAVGGILLQLFALVYFLANKIQ